MLPRMSNDRGMLAASRRMLAALSLSALVALPMLAASGCGYNDVMAKDEDVKAAWAEVQNQYKRRADLVPQLVQVVKAAANFEQQTLSAVVEARAGVGSMKVDQSVIDDPQKLAAFEAAQNKLTGAHSPLLVVSENNPDL
jgi:LemA protein